MKVSVEKLPTSEAVVDIEFSWEEMEKASDKAYRKLAQQVDVQGFRRGKAPRSLIERRIGKEAIYQEGAESLISEAYRNAIEEYDLTPITQPTLDAPLVELDQPYKAKMTVPIVTPVELTDYQSLHFDREEASVSPEEIEKELENLRTRTANWEEVDRPAQQKDRVTVDLKLTSGEQQISDLKDNPFELTDERHGLFSGMDEQIVGMKAGEHKDFSTNIPDDYSNAKLAGKEANFSVTVHKIEANELPELTDEFAAKVSDGQFETIDEITKFLGEQILENKKRALREALREKALQAVIDGSTFVIHPLLVEQETDEMVHQFGHMLEEQRLSMDQYLLMMKKTREEYIDELKPEAEKRIQRQLVLEEIARQENLEVSAEELEALYNAYAQMGQELPRTEQQIRSLAISYRREKALNRLLEITAGPEPEEEKAEEEASVNNAALAAAAGDEALTESDNENKDTVVSANASVAETTEE